MLHNRIKFKIGVAINDEKRPYIKSKELIEKNSKTEMHTLNITYAL